MVFGRQFCLYDAGSTLAANTDTVQQWNDKSGNGYHLSQATAGRRPQYLSGGFNSKPTVQFTAATPTGMLTATGVATGTGASASGFFVGQMLTGTAGFGRAIVYGPPADQDYSNGGRVWALRDGSSNAIEVYNGGALASNAVSLATNYRFGSVYDGVNVTTYVNNANATAAGDSNAMTSAGAIGIGIEVSFGVWGGTQGWDGPISEAVMTTGALSAGDRTSLDDYFKTHWGL